MRVVVVAFKVPDNFEAHSGGRSAEEAVAEVVQAGLDYESYGFAFTVNKATDEGLDIWHDDEGIWRQIDGQTYGPFATEKEAEDFELPTEATVVQTPYGPIITGGGR
jgi:hypothetical protein